MKRLIPCLLMAMATQSHAASTVICEYQMVGTPMGQVSFQIEGQQPGQTAKVELFYAPVMNLSITTEILGPDEILNLSLGKEDPNNYLRLIIYTPSNSGVFKSKLINPAASIGKELQGFCKLSS